MRIEEAEKPPEISGNTSLGQRDSIWSAQVAALDNEIERLKTTISEEKWLLDIAETQKRDPQRYILAECWILENNLAEEPLFIEFNLRLQSSIVYPLTLSRVNGSIRFANQRLMHKLDIGPHGIENLPIGEINRLAITQHLTRQEAVRILNQHNDFCFDQLAIELTSSKLDAPIRLTPRGSFPNRQMLEKYPKLTIEFVKARCLPLSSQKEFMVVGTFITLEVRIKNNRRTRIEIEAAQSDVTTIAPRYVLQPDTGEICEQKTIGRDGVLRLSGVRLKNLAATSFVVLGNGEVSGCFQFTLDNVIPSKLQDSVGSLTLTDKFGEQHTGNFGLPTGTE